MATAQNPVATVTTIGSGCAGSAGIPALTAVAPPFLGERLQLELANVPPQSFCFRVLGTSSPGSGLPGMPGCFQHAALDAVIGGFADANGRATFDFVVPEAISLAGLVLYGQGAAIDPTANQLGITTSNGLALHLGVHPQVTVASFGPATVGPDGVVEIRGTNFPADPEAFCVVAEDTTNQDFAFLRGETVTRVGGQDVLRARVMTVGPNFRTGQLMIMTGNNRHAAVGGRQVLLAPGQQWAWNGLDVPEQGAMVGNLTILAPERVIVDPKRWTMVGGHLEMRLPLADPCTTVNPGANWRPRTSLTSDIHLNVHKPGGGVHYDVFLQSVTVAVLAPGDTIATQHLDQIHEVLSDRYGVSVDLDLNFTTMVVGTEVVVQVLPINGSTMSGGFGTTYIDCPEESQALIVRKPLVGAAIADSLQPAAGTPPSLSATASPAALSSQVFDFACSGDGNTGVTSDSGGAFTFFNIDSGTVLGSTTPDANFVDAAIDSSLQDYLLAVKGNRLRAIRLSTRTVTATTTLPATATGVKVSDTGRFLAVWGNASPTVRIYEVRPNGSLGALSSAMAPANVVTVTWNPAAPATTLTSVNSNGTLTDFAVSAAGIISPLTTVTGDLRPSPTWVPMDLAFAPGGQKAYYAYKDNAFLATQWEIVELDYAVVGNLGRFQAATSSTTQFALEIPVRSTHSLAVTSDGAWLMAASGSTLNGPKVYAFPLTPGEGIAASSPAELTTPSGQNILGVLSRKK